jgi:hypothetical protein
MLEQTETEWGPWTIVEATDRRYTWWKVLNTLAESLAAALRARGIDPESLSAEAMTARAISEQPSAVSDTTEPPVSQSR